MAKQYFLPRRQDALLPWCSNLKTKLPNYGSTLGFNGADLAKVVEDLDFIIYLLQQWLPAVRGFSEGATAYVKSALRGEGASAALPVFTPPALGTVSVTDPGALTRVLDFIEDKIKAADGYTDAIGEDLQIIGPSEPDNALPEAPEASAEVRGSEVLIKFKKSGHMGVWIESQVASEEAWAYLAIDTGSPYNDARPLKVAGQPEKRRYRLCFWDGDPTRVWSDVIEVTFGG
jgi:hypothetical protein